MQCYAGFILDILIEIRPFARQDGYCMKRKYLLKRNGSTNKSFFEKFHAVFGNSKIRLPIRSKITIPYLILAMIVALAASVTAYKIVMENIDQRFNNQLYEARLIASSAMVNEEQRMLETLRLIANTRGISQAIVNQDSQILRDLSLGIAINNQEEFIQFLGMNGQIILSLQHKTGGLLEEYASSTGGETIQKNWPFVQAILEGKSDEHGNKFAGYAQAPWGNYFYVDGPVFDDNGSQIGVIIIGKSVETLALQLRTKTLGQVTFYDMSGITIYSTLPASVSPLSEANVKTILTNQDTSSFRSNGGDRKMQFEGLTYSELLGPWEIRSKADIGIMGISLAQNRLVAASLPIRAVILVLASLSIFFIIIIGTNLSRLITTPIIDLVTASKEVASGNLDIQVNPQSNDEIALLGTNFNQMVTSLDKSQKDLLGAYDSTLEGWCKALELRDNETKGHTLRVTELTVNLARAYGLSEDEIIHIRRGALLHDIGKVGIPDGILRKPGPLTEEEWKIMRQHPKMAYDMLKNIEYLRPAMDIPCFHHEHWDGSGYPNGLKGKEIPLAARLFSIVDSWDALTSNRPYRNEMSVSNTQKNINADKGTRFDPELVDFFMAFISEKVTRNRT
jgi:HD-GYP domain-containing protein (c-di-GMP phosphodiesterase class II)